MEQLLRDGGDLESMDRSLLDYNAMKNANVGKCNKQQESGIVNGGTANGNGLPAVMSPTGMESYQISTSISEGSNRASSFNPALTPVTPPVSPCSPLPPPPMLQENGNGDVSGDLLMDINNVVKKDLVVRFTDKQNTVQHVTSTMPLSSETTRNTPSTAGGNKGLPNFQLQNV